MLYYIMRSFTKLKYNQKSCFGGFLSIITIIIQLTNTIKNKKHDFDCISIRK